MKVRRTKSRLRVLPRGYRWVEPNERKQEGDLCALSGRRTWTETNLVGQRVFAARFYIRKK